jgi:hypothetical protein
MHALNIISFGFTRQQAHKSFFFLFDIDNWVSFGHATQRIGTKSKEVSEDIVDFLGFIQPSAEHLAATG